LITTLPQLSSSDISSKSRSDYLVKATALGQVLWLFIQTIVRGFYAQPISQLEIATLAFSACAFIAYLFSSEKPQDVQLATRVGSVDALTPWQTQRLLEASGKSLFWHLLGFAPFLNKYSQERELQFLGPVERHRIPGPSDTFNARDPSRTYPYHQLHISGHWHTACKRGFWRNPLCGLELPLPHRCREDAVEGGQCR